MLDLYRRKGIAAIRAQFLAAAGTRRSSSFPTVTAAPPKFRSHRFPSLEIAPPECPTTSSDQETSSSTRRVPMRGPHQENRFRSPVNRKSSGNPGAAPNPPFPPSPPLPPIFLPPHFFSP